MQAFELARAELACAGRVNMVVKNKAAVMRIMLVIPFVYQQLLIYTMLPSKKSTSWPFPIRDFTSLIRWA
jgi:hypothetical protein